MKLEINQVEFRMLVVACFRYALGRKTHAVQCAVSFIIKQKDRMPTHLFELMIREIDVAISRDQPGMDVEQWER